MDINKYPYRIEKGCVWRVVDGETIILSDNANKLHTLSDVGGEIWRLADGKITIDGIIAKIVEAFEVERETASRDIVEFIQELSEMNLIVLKSNSIG